MTERLAQIHAAAPPHDSLIAAYTEQPNTYVDAYHAVLPRDVTLPGFLRAFYGSNLFAAERAVLRIAGHGSTAADIAALAEGRADTFAAWTVETRRDTEILLKDVSGRTRSWLAVEASLTETRLWFGSVVMPTKGREGSGIGPIFTLLLGPHRHYSKALLRAALRKLRDG